jgi:hypothetical protein
MILLWPSLGSPARSNYKYGPSLTIFLADIPFRRTFLGLEGSENGQKHDWLATFRTAMTRVVALLAMT